MVLCFNLKIVEKQTCDKVNLLAYLRLYSKLIGKSLVTLTTIKPLGWIKTLSNVGNQRWLYIIVANVIWIGIGTSVIRYKCARVIIASVINKLLNIPLQIGTGKG